MSIADITNTQKKKTVGRPRVHSTATMVRLPPFMVREIDNWRRQQQDLPTRPEAIRRLLKEALST